MVNERVNVRGLLILLAGMLAMGLVFTACRNPAGYPAGQLKPEPEVSALVTSTSEWVDAINEIKSGGNNENYYIKIDGNIQVDGFLLLPLVR